jgi:hypothetical protein
VRWTDSSLYGFAVYVPEWSLAFDHMIILCIQLMNSLTQGRVSDAL